VYIARVTDELCEVPAVLGRLRNSLYNYNHATLRAALHAEASNQFSPARALGA
jgi:hypothetical protein